MIKVLITLGMLLISTYSWCADTKTVLNNESFEIALTNTRPNDSDYSDTRGIYAGFSAPVYVTDYGITSIAIDGGYANLGTMTGSTALGDPYSIRMTSVSLGARATGLITYNLSGFIKANVASVKSDSNLNGNNREIEGQLVVGLEMHLPKGLGLNLSYTQLEGDISSIMLGMTLR